jgi:hypothetical protein
VFWLAVALFLAYGLAAVAPLLRYGLRGRVGALIAWCFVPIIPGCPLLIPPAKAGLRVVAVFLTADIAFKVIDYFRHWTEFERSTILREYYRFLIPFPLLSLVYPDHKQRLQQPVSLWPDVIRLVGGTAGFVIALLLVMATSHVALLQSSFVVDHLVMLLIFVLAIESLSRAMCGIERLAGFDTHPIVQNAYLSRSVAEFWQRWNYRMHDWLYRNVFEATGGRRTPIRSLLMACLVSGIFHEVAFAMATSQFTGYQFAFFAIQGPAALVSRKLERMARRGGFAGKLIAHGTTLLFLAITSVLFFDGVGRIFPFVYAHPSPLP